MLHSYRDNGRCTATTHGACKKGQFVSISELFDICCQFVFLFFLCLFLFFVFFVFLIVFGIVYFPFCWYVFFGIC